MEKVPPMDLGQGEFANLSLPIVLDEDDNPIVPMKRLN